MADSAVLKQLRERIRAIEEGNSFSEPAQAGVSNESPSSMRARDVDALRKRMREIEAKPAARSTHLEDDGASADERRNAFSRIIDWLNARDRSERSIREKLAREGYGEAEIESAVSRAREYGMIDDLRYADVLIRSRLSQGKGAAGIERELEAEGISAFDVEGWPYEFGISDESEYQRALALLDKNPTRSKNKREGAYRKLMQKGFSSSVAASAARTWSEGLNGE